MISTNVSEFTRKITEFARTLPERDLVPFQQGIALRILRGVIFKTPVKDGRARGGWQVGINEIPDGPTGLDPNGGETMAKGVQVIGRLEPYGAIFISNPIEYIVPLENGHSKQAPGGMVALTLQEVSSKFT